MLLGTSWDVLMISFGFSQIDSFLFHKIWHLLHHHGNGHHSHLHGLGYSMTMGLALLQAFIYQLYDNQQLEIIANQHLSR